MATVKEQLDASINTFNETAAKVNKFINGTDSETISSDTGEKPTIAKIAKDAEDRVSASITDLTINADQVSTDKAAIEQLKSDTQQIVTDFDNGHFATLNDAITANSDIITQQTANIALKAGIKAEPIAELYANSNGTIYSSKNVASITYVQAGVNDIVLDPSLNGKTQVAVGVGLSWNVIVASYGIRSDGKHRITTVKSNATANHPYYVRIYELDTE